MQVLLSVTPWIANLELNKKWAGTPSEDLLNLLYGITERRTQQGNDVRELWLTAANNPSNFSAILDFVLSRVVTGIAAGPASTSKVRRLQRACGLCLLVHVAGTLSSLLHQAQCVQPIVGCTSGTARRMRFALCFRSAVSGAEP